MFDIFGIRAKRIAKKQAEEAERQARIQTEKEAYQQRKTLITDYLKKYDEEQQAKDKKRYTKRKETAKKVNSQCPKCGSKNVINHIKHTKGEIHGDGHTSVCSSSSGFLGGMCTTVNSSSKIDGELDTYPVNKCKDCGHEWKVEKVEYETSSSIFSVWDTYGPQWMVHRIEEYFDMKYDPNDITEPCNSLEEKREKYIEKCQETHWAKDYKKVPKYMLEYMVEQVVRDEDYEAENKLFGWNRSTDRFQYKFPENIWEVVKTLIGWEGTL